MFWNKKAEKELQMIFGLFVLLIISLVVLSLFFKFTEKSSGKMEGASTEYFTKADMDKAIQDCQLKCDNIKDDNTLIEFCKKTVQIDWNTDKVIKGKVEYGKWQFCENKIPCFVLVDTCQSGKYDGNKCNEVLSDPNNNNLAAYQALQGTGDTAGFADGCGLTEESSNWKVKYGFA